MCFLNDQHSSAAWTRSSFAFNEAAIRMNPLPRPSSAYDGLNTEWPCKLLMPSVGGALSPLAFRIPGSAHSALWGTGCPSGPWQLRAVAWIAHCLASPRRTGLCGVSTGVTAPSTASQSCGLCWEDANDRCAVFASEFVKEKLA